MSEKWFWLSDWAADMEIWEDDLVEASPEADHTFISYEKIMKQPKEDRKSTRLNSSHL